MLNRSNMVVLITFTLLISSWAMSHPFVVGERAGPDAEIAIGDLKDKQLVASIMRCNKDIKAARQTYIKSVRQTKQQLLRTLTRYQDRLTQSGDFETALAVKNLAKKIEQDIADKKHRKKAKPAQRPSTSTNPHDWPKAQCPQCNRPFFPGWNGEYTKCSRCRDSRRNIFDFDN